MLGYPSCSANLCREEFVDPDKGNERLRRIIRNLVNVAIPLDPGAFRLFLAMLVFVHHFSGFALGSFAVYVFFQLSGFWVQRMWTSRYVGTNQPYATYLISRLWRLAPNMLLVSALAVPVLLIIGVPSDQLFSSGFSQLIISTSFLVGYAWLNYLPVGSAWSLDVEMQFYLIAPILIAALVRFGIWRPLLLSGLITICFSQFSLPPTLPKYLVFFIIGAIAAHINWRPSNRMAKLSAGLVVVIVIGIFNSPVRDILIGGASPGPNHFLNPEFNALLAVLAVPYAIYTTSRSSDSDDRMLADLSYIIYLLHWVAMQWFFTISGSFLHRLPSAALCFVIVPLVALGIWRWFDFPLNKARGRWVNKRQVQKD